MRFSAALVLTVGATLVASVRADLRSSRVTKEAAVSFRAASLTPTAGYEAIPQADGGVLYVSPRESFPRDAVVSVETVRTRDGQALALSLTDEAIGRLADVDRLAVFMDARLVSTASLDGLSAGGKATITGLSPREASRLARLVKAGSAAPTGSLVTVVPREGSGRSGDLFTVDVYVSGVADLRTYQVSLDARGGTSGSLTREGMSIDADRADYVFGASQAIKATDEQHGRLGAVLFDGSVRVVDAVYLGTYAFRASADASGTFEIGVRMNGDSFLADAQSERTAFRPDDATITIGSPRSRLGH